MAVAIAQEAQETNLYAEAEAHEKEWLDALQVHDSAALSNLLHEEFTSTSARYAGEILRKRNYIEEALRMKICNYQIRNVTVYEVELVVVVKARLTCNSKFNDQEIHDDLLITDVWLRNGNAWSALTRHASRLP